MGKYAHKEIIVVGKFLAANMPFRHVPRFILLHKLLSVSVPPVEYGRDHWSLHTTLSSVCRTRSVRVSWTTLALPEIPLVQFSDRCVAVVDELWRIQPYYTKHLRAGPLQSLLSPCGELSSMFALIAWRVSKPGVSQLFEASATAFFINSLPFYFSLFSQSGTSLRSSPVCCLSVAFKA